MIFAIVFFFFCFFLLLYTNAHLARNSSVQIVLSSELQRCSSCWFCFVRGKLSLHMSLLSANYSYFVFVLPSPPSFRLLQWVVAAVRSCSNTFWLKVEGLFPHSASWGCSFNYEAAARVTEHRNCLGKESPLAGTVCLFDWLGSLLETKVLFETIVLLNTKCISQSSMCAQWDVIAIVENTHTHTQSCANAESHYVTVLIMLIKQRAAYASGRGGQAMTGLRVMWQGQEELCRVCVRGVDEEKTQ